MDQEPQEVSIARYLRFVIFFLLIMFSALGAYEYYYGAQAKIAQQLQEQYDNSAMSGASSSSTVPQ